LRNEGALAVKVSLPLLLTLASLALLVPSRRASAGPSEWPSGRMVLEPAEKRYAFTMQNKPWGNVFTWFTDLTGLPVRSSYKLSGTCRFTSPAKKQYTVPEIVDIINEGLRANGTIDPHVLVRGSRMFLVVPLDHDTDFGAIAPEVRVAGLPRCGNTEFVKVRVRLKGKSAEEVAPGLEKWLGPFGAVTPIKATNELRLLDTASNVREMLKVLRQMTS
jgi:hypothetical protein